MAIAIDLAALPHDPEDLRQYSRQLSAELRAPKGVAPSNGSRFLKKVTRWA